jgi:hypothetical protein
MSENDILSGSKLLGSAPSLIITSTAAVLIMSKMIGVNRSVKLGYGSSKVRRVCSTVRRCFGQVQRPSISFRAHGTRSDTVAVCSDHPRAVALLTVTMIEIRQSQFWLHWRWSVTVISSVTNFTTAAAFRIVFHPQPPVRVHPRSLTWRSREGFIHFLMFSGTERCVYQVYKTVFSRLTFFGVWVFRRFSTSLYRRHSVHTDAADINHPVIDRSGGSMIQLRVMRSRGFKGWKFSSWVQVKIPWWGSGTVWGFASEAAEYSNFR